MKKATFIKDVSDEFQGQAHLYKLSEPLENYDYIIVSGAFVPFGGPETFIFPATENGEIQNWSELEGSFQGDINIELALRNAGYKVD